MFGYKVAEVHIYKTCTKIKPKSYTADSSCYLPSTAHFRKIEKDLWWLSNNPLLKDLAVNLRSPAILRALETFPHLEGCWWRHGNGGWKVREHLREVFAQSVTSSRLRGFTSPMKIGVFSPELRQQNSTWGVTPTGWSQTPPTVTGSVEVLLY